MEVQIFLSLAVVLGGAFIALLCDLLKNDNESLRASNIALRVRHDEQLERERFLYELRAQAVELVLRDRALRRKARKSKSKAKLQGAATETQNHMREGTGGLVVVVGVEGDRQIVMDQLRQLNATLPAEASATDEVVLFFPGEQGPAARVRMQQVSSKLWECQLAAGGAVELTLNWGAAIVQLEPIEYGVTHARQQMLDTRQRRRVLAERLARPRARSARA